MEYIFRFILWTLALYGLFDIVKNVIYLCTYTNYKNDGIYIIVAVKNQENYIENFIRSFIFRVLYGKENVYNNIIITDLKSTDNTKELLHQLSNEYEEIKVLNWKECKDFIDNINDI